MQNYEDEEIAASTKTAQPNSISNNSTSRRRISDALLRSLKPTVKAYRMAVGGGLYLEVMPSGSKLWRWKYRLDGRENRFALGKYPTMSLADARVAVEQARKLVKEGRHPSLQKKLDDLKAAHGRLQSFEDVFISLTSYSFISPSSIPSRRCW
jgi:hypothetical protein